MVTWGYTAAAVQNLTLQKMCRVLCPLVPGFKPLADSISQEKHPPPSFSRAGWTLCRGQG